MKKSTRAIRTAILLCTVQILLLSGCGSQPASGELTTLELKKNGNVVNTIVETFVEPIEEKYYDLNELQEMASEEAELYNAEAGSEKVTVGKASVKDGMLRMSITFKDSAAYAEYNQQALYFGTITDAFNAAYNLDISLKSVTDDTRIGRDDILDMGEKHIAVIREAVRVKTYGEILYISDGVTLEDKNTAVVTDGDNLTYIIFK